MLPGHLLDQWDVRVPALGHVHLVGLDRVLAVDPARRPAEDLGLLELRGVQGVSGPGPYGQVCAVVAGQEVLVACGEVGAADGELFEVGLGRHEA